MSKIIPNPSRSDKRLASGAKVVRMEVGRDSAKARADLVFVIDTTGSMNDKIDGLIESCQSFVDRLATRRIDWVAAVVGFGDLTVEGDRIVATPFSSSAERVKSLRTAALFRRRQRGGIVPRGLVGSSRPARLPGRCDESGRPDHR